MGGTVRGAAEVATVSVRSPRIDARRPLMRRPARCTSTSSRPAPGPRPEPSFRAETGTNPRIFRPARTRYGWSEGVRRCKIACMTRKRSGVRIPHGPRVHPGQTASGPQTAARFRGPCRFRARWDKARVRGAAVGSAARRHDRLGGGEQRFGIVGPVGQARTSHATGAWVCIRWRLRFRVGAVAYALTRAWPRWKSLRPVRSSPRTSMSARDSWPYPGWSRTSARSWW